MVLARVEDWGLPHLGRNIRGTCRAGRKRMLLTPGSTRPRIKRRASRAKRLGHRYCTAKKVRQYPLARRVVTSWGWTGALC